MRMLGSAGTGILCNPFVIGNKLVRIKVGVQKIFGTVEHCIVACRLDFIQKSLADIGIDLLAASSVDALVLDIKGNRVTKLVRFDCLDDLFGCPSGCLCCGGVAVQIHSHIQTRCQRAADMFLKMNILFECAIVVAPANTYNRKINAGCLDFLPIYIVLCIRNINSVFCQNSTSFSLSIFGA